MTVEGLYRRLPGGLRTVAASAQGHRLRRWRYGPETDRLVDEAHDREAWDRDRWTAWLAERLPTGLEERPILEKEQLRADPRGFVTGAGRLYE